MKPEPYDVLMDRKAEERCPCAKGLRAGDETVDMCDINDKFCLLESGDTCEYYQEWLEEIKGENTETK